jgi:hypothetical protein
MTISMGLGSVPLGEGALGFDSPTFCIPPALPPLPVAVQWNAQNRALQQNADGTFQPVHPVDQMVQMLLTIEQGSVPALGPVGQRYRQRLLGVPASKAQSIALDETKVTLADLIASGDITLLNVTVDASVVGRKIIRVGYRNNRLQAVSAPGAPNSQTTQTISVNASRPRG